MLEEIEKTEIITDDRALGVIHHVHVAIEDNVTGGCWTNSAAVKKRVTAQLEAAGIASYDDPLQHYHGFNAKLRISGNGYRIQGIGVCVASIETNVLAWTSRRFGALETTGKIWVLTKYASLSECGTVASGPENLNGYFLRMAERCTDSFITDVYRGRRDDRVQDLINAFDYYVDDPSIPMR